MKSIPNHIAFIMDGNRRWATERHLPKIVGHTKGAEAIKPLIKVCLDAEVSYVTLWSLSTENLRSRGEKELNHIFSLFDKLVSYLGDFIEQDVKLQVIGDIKVLPKNVQESLSDVIEKTKHNTKMTLVLAVNYGGRDEFIRAVRTMINEQVQEAEVTEKLISSYLDTDGVPDPDLIIRTGGYCRLSGYLPWQSVYSELYFAQEYWPAFTPKLLQKAMDWFSEVQRNRGK